uniref:Uncharacterized protein n=2 Tax=Cyprinus carpio TaxID=7962 RepID=A0A8C1ZNA4_CYPCA
NTANRIFFSKGTKLYIESSKT